MKIKLTLTLLTLCISTLQAGQFTLADITPAKKACADIACVLSNHPGSIALTGCVAGVLMYGYADREYTKASKAAEKINGLKTAFESNAPLFSDDYQGCSQPLKDAIKTYENARKELQNKEANILGSVRARVGHTQRTYTALPKNFSDKDVKDAHAEMEQAEQDLKEKEANPDLQETREHVATLQKAARTHFDDELRLLNTQAIQAHYAKLWYCGVFIALASAAGYTFYKTYPQLQKWYAAYVK